MTNFLLGNIMIRPFITVENRAQEALDFYRSVFPTFSLVSLQHHATPHDNLVQLAVFSLQGHELMISDSFVSHEWSITPGVSLFMSLTSKDELQSLANALAVDGTTHMPAGSYGFSTFFAWVEDRFGVNWQLNVE